MYIGSSRGWGDRSWASLFYLLYRALKWIVLIFQILQTKIVFPYVLQLTYIWKEWNLNFPWKKYPSRFFVQFLYSFEIRRWNQSKTYTMLSTSEVFEMLTEGKPAQKSHHLLDLCWIVTFDCNFSCFESYCYNSKLCYTFWYSQKNSSNKQRKTFQPVSINLLQKEYKNGSWILQTLRYRRVSSFLNPENSVAIQVSSISIYFQQR